TLPRPPTSTRFPYTTLFRSSSSATWRARRERRPEMAATPLPVKDRPRRRRSTASGGRSPWFHVLMIPFTLAWIAPMVFVLVVSLRPFDDLIARGLTALPTTFSLEGFRTALSSGGIAGALRNSLIVTVVPVVLSLFLASLAAFALSRYRIPGRLVILLVMLAGNLLPPQILLIPVAKIAQGLGIYDSLTALIAVH